MPRPPPAENRRVSIAPPAIVMDCLGCRRTLKLPGTAAGRVIKCPACGGMSPVPAPSGDDPEEFLGDLLSEMFHEGEDEEDYGDAPPESPTAPTAPAAAAATHAEKEEIVLEEAPPRTAAPPPRAAPAATPAAPIAAPSPAPTPAATAPTAGVSRRGAPTFLQTGPPRRLPRPFLAVYRCSIAGVELSFPESQLADPLFRASMPERCVITGDPRGETNLNARPMVFINKDEQGNRQARAVETQFEIAVDPSYRHQDYMGKMGTVDGLVSPFDLPMPYMVSADLFDASLRCLSVRSDTHAAYCRVILPAAATAAAWIANVNGTANEAWHYLQQHASQMSCEAWVRLPHVVRDRINAWCSFAPGEAFIAYARHAETVVKESGLGGLLVTDRRLIYHMFRKNVEFPLDRPLRVRIRHDAHGVHFAAGSDGEPLKKLGAVNVHEVPLVFEALESAATDLTVDNDGGDDESAPDEGPDLNALFAA